MRWYFAKIPVDGNIQKNEKLQNTIVRAFLDFKNMLEYDKIFREYSKNMAWYAKNI